MVVVAVVSAVNIEYGVCELIAVGLNPKVPLIIEGRQPAVMATYMSRVLRKANTFRVYLSCSVREQALRFVSREGGANGPALSAQIDARLPPNKQYDTLHAVAQDITKLVRTLLRHRTPLHATSRCGPPRHRRRPCLDSLRHLCCRNGFGGGSSVAVLFGVLTGGERRGTGYCGNGIDFEEVRGQSAPRRRRPQAVRLHLRTRRSHGLPQPRALRSRRRYHSLNAPKELPTQYVARQHHSTPQQHLTAMLGRVLPFAVLAGYEKAVAAAAASTATATATTKL